MTVILVDARHLGTALYRGRRSACLGRKDLAPILRITRRELAQYETGRAVIPEDVLWRIISNGIMLLKARKLDSQK